MSFQEIVSENEGGLVQELVSKAGLSETGAKQFLPVAIAKITELLSSDDVDIRSLLSGDVISMLMSKLDIGGLAAQAGIDEDSANQGLQQLVPSLMTELQTKALGDSDLASLLRGKPVGGGFAAGVSALFDKN